MQKIIPFLWFDGNAIEAMNFYTSIFQNSKIMNIMYYEEAGPEPEGKVMSATFETCWTTIYCIKWWTRIYFHTCHIIFC